jgi:hypothetical protein
MSKLEWGKVEDRTFETGVERGVLYPLSGPGVVWNGITEVNEKTSRDVKSYYLDGIKFLDHAVAGAFSGKLSAYTYPDELDAILGVAEWIPGVRVHDQRMGMFHLSYRTLIGDAYGGTDVGYKLHLLYNLTANPNDQAFSTMGDKVDPKPFEWDLSGVQTSMWGIRPANHLSFDSRYMDPDLLAGLEAQLYGTDTVPAEGENPEIPGTDPTMPDLVQLLADLEAAAA